MKNFYRTAEQAFEKQHGFGGNDMFATGELAENPNTAPAGQSEPFIISLNNTTGGAITNVTIFNALAGIGAFNNGVTAGVVCTYGYTTVSYAQFLQWLSSRTFQVAAWQVVTTTDAQALQTFTVQTVDMFGNLVAKSVVPRVDPNWNKVGNVWQRDTFAINSATTITLASLGAGLTATYYFYPNVVEGAGGAWKTKQIESVIRPMAISNS